MEDNITDILKNQLSQAHDSWKLCYSQCSTIKKWCLTLWSAVVLGIAYKPEIPAFMLLSFFIFFCLGFFVLEAIFAEPMQKIVNYQKYIAEQFRNREMNCPYFLVEFLDDKKNGDESNAKRQSPIDRIIKQVIDLKTAAINHKSGQIFYTLLFLLSIFMWFLHSCSEL